MMPFFSAWIDKADRKMKQTYLWIWVISLFLPYMGSDRKRPGRAMAFFPRIRQRFPVDDAKHEWVAEPGKFEAIIGSSSRDIKGIVPFELK